MIAVMTHISCGQGVGEKEDRVLTGDRGQGIGRKRKIWVNRGLEGKRTGCGQGIGFSQESI